ncbi:hypothetical protein Gorai_010100, partial [Gossypium raimondii]|nr:hypothetical protein [Gossypium raimondii]
MKLLGKHCLLQLWLELQCLLVYTFTLTVPSAD